MIEQSGHGLDLRSKVYTLYTGVRLTLGIAGHFGGHLVQLRISEMTFFKPLLSGYSNFSLTLTLNKRFFTLTLNKLKCLISPEGVGGVQLHFIVLCYVKCKASHYNKNIVCLSVQLFLKVSSSCVPYTTNFSFLISVCFF